MKSHYTCEHVNGRTVFTNKKKFSFVVIFTPTFGEIENAPLVHVVTIKPLTLAVMPNAQLIVNGSYSQVMHIIRSSPEYFKLRDVKGDVTLYNMLQKLIPSWTHTKFRLTLFDVPDSQITNIGAAKVIYPCSYGRDRRLTTEFAIDETLARLNNSGFGSVTDSRITIGRLPRHIGGVYHIDDDEIVLNTSLIRKPEAMKRTLCHEHAHRHWYLNLTDEDRQILTFQFAEFMSLGAHVLTQDRRYVNTLRANELVIYNGAVRRHNGIWRIDELSSETGYIKLRHVENPAWYLDETYTTFYDHGFRFEDHEIRFHDYIPSVASMIEPTKEMDIWFPSLYSATNVEEWYAEGITLLSFNQLKGEVKTFFERFIK